MVAATVLGLPAPVAAVSLDVVISQVYGGGGNSGATFTQDFIELYNRGDTAVPLEGWSVQYATGMGTSWQVTPLTGSIAPGGYYLIHQAQGTGGTTPLPTADASGSIPMGAFSGKVALVTNPVPLDCDPPSCDFAPGVRDFVGYGSTDDSETAPTPALSNTTAAIRAAGGATDTDNNASDFVVGAPNPRNSGPVPGTPTGPTITTSATATVAIGGAISDTATVTGAPGPSPAPTGWVTFRLYGPDNATCVGAPVFTSGAQALGGGPPPTAASGPFTPTAPGTYRWIAAYSGDANYQPVTASCNAANETSVVTAKASPTISTQASAGGLVGTPVRDVATLSGGSSPTGAVTFRLFSDATCTTQVFTSTNDLSGLTATSGDFTPASAGTYRWTAVYSGDADNNPATSPCNAPNESVTVTPFVAPTFTRTITADTLGPVTVNAGESVLISGTRVVGPVTVSPGGALSVENARITRGVTANAPAFFRMCGTDVSGPPPATALSVTNAPVPIRVGDPASGCAGNRFAGQVVLTGNLAVTFGANAVSHNVTVDNNGPGSTVVKANTVYGALGCAGNNPPPTNAGQMNSAGVKTGQCAGL